MNGTKKTRVLVVDDSAVVRRAISEVLSADPEIEVVGTACDPYVARDKILELNPDVLTLDIEMPRMDGLSFLRVLNQHRPMPVVVVSSLTQAGSRAALAVLEAGAVDVLAKPSSAWSVGDLGEQLAARVKGAARARLRRPQEPTGVVSLATSTGSFHPRQIVLIGASTGGTEAIKNVLTRLPDGLPPICIVQHIPPVFSRAFAERLNECSTMEVREGVQGDELKPGLALVAPGDFHMALEWTGARYRVRLNQSPPMHHTRPAVDVLFGSVAACAGANVVAVILTGMGSDGAQGMRRLKQTGAATIAQDEETCVVYGMPSSAVELGVVDHVLPLSAIPHAILRLLQERAGSAATQRSAGVPTSPIRKSLTPNLG